MLPTLLVLDSNTTIQRMTKLAFKAQGVRVNAVQAGRDAFEEIEANPPDVIFTDDASKLVAFLKSRPNLSRIPVVLLRGAFDSGENAAETTVDAVLNKPLQPDAMVDCVKRLLRKPKVDSSNDAPTPVNRTDPDLDLERYFDQLSLAFNRAHSTPPQLETHVWQWSEPTGNNPRGQTPPPGRSDDRQRPAAASVDGELVEQVTQRVLDRLGERIVRSTATEIVSRLSKWLIVNEVERSKAGR